MTTELRTARLILREWRDTDVGAFVQMTSAPDFSAHLLPFAEQAEAEAWVARKRNHFDRHGYGPWVVELARSGEFIGCVGLSVVPFDAPFTPAVEIAWRLSKEHRGQGFATEAAAAALADGFARLGLSEITANTAPHNWPSRRVMERIGMQRDEAGDFDHPMVPPGHPLRRQVLYRARAPRPSPTP
jgi:RimJ/RimL family protein N-acetyltransferase